jgi:hypothetical protein
MPTRTIYFCDIKGRNIRILVDIAEKQIHALVSLSRGVKRLRAAPIRDAVGDYLARQRTQQPSDAFGLWGNQKIDEGFSRIQPWRTDALRDLGRLLN